MVSFSPLLRATLQDTGENSNTWGDVANNGVFLKLEAGIAGVATLSVNTGLDITLTANNGSADQASNMILKLNGEPTANINIIIPNSTKMYAIDGTAFTGANSITIKTTIGTGIAFNAGEKGIVYTDGTDTFLLAQPTVETVPSGVIVMWNGQVSAIPTGWSFCNGTGGTPDLRNRFIIAADTDNGTIPTTNITGAPTSTGGSKDLNFNSASAGAHTHTGATGGHALTAAENGPHTHNYVGGSIGGGVGLGSSAQTNSTGTTTSSGSGTPHTHPISSDGDHVHNITSTNGNLPPYYALAFIQKD